MFNALKKLNQMLDKNSKIQFSFLFLMLGIKSFLDGLGLGLIVPYIAAVADSSIFFDNKVFQSINTYTRIESHNELIYWLSIIMVVFFILKNLFSICTVYYQYRLIFTKRADQR